MMKLLVVIGFFLIALKQCEARIESRITGGSTVRYGVVKCYVALVITNGETIKTCGGCLLPRTSTKYAGDRILTSAACLFNAAGGKSVNIKFYLGLSGPSGFVTAMTIKDVYKNVLFDPSKNSSGADIAQVVLESRFSAATTLVEPSTPSTEATADAYVGEELFVCGHGDINNEGEKPGFRGLQCTYLRAVAKSECAAVMQPNVPLPSGVICTKNLDAKNACNGDQGSPVFSNKTGSLELVGVVSFFPNGRANARCEDGHHTVITQVGAQKEFVDDPQYLPPGATTTT